jgi:hypothetical protein
MLFQPAQVLEIAGISKDTLRHWKKFIGPIAGVDGRRHQYTLTELVGICMIARAIQDLGLQISQFSGYADMLFLDLTLQLPPSGVPRVLCIVPNGMFFANAAELPDADAVAYIKILPIIDSVFSTLDPKTRLAAPQLELPF